MNVFDIILLLLLLWAAYKGYSQGIIIQIGGIIGLLAGAWAAFRYGTQIGGFLGMEGGTAAVAGFIVTMVATVIVLAILSRMTRGLFRLTGLGALDHLAGAVFSVLKVSLFVGIMLYAFDKPIKSHDTLAAKAAESKLYGPIVAVPEYLFPYVNTCKERVMEEFFPRTDRDGTAADDEEAKTERI